MPEFHGITLEKLSNVATSVAQSLSLHKRPYVCWLLGPMGAGKTTFTRELLYALGLYRNCAVTSPTFTYMNEYSIDGVWYAHLDLYRATKGLSVEDLGVNDVRNYQGTFIEWPASFEHTDTLLKPTHTIEIKVIDESTRIILFNESHT